MGESVNNLLQKSDELIVNMVKEAGELVKNFIEMSKNDPRPRFCRRRRASF